MKPKDGYTAKQKVIIGVWAGILVWILAMTIRSTDWRFADRAVWGWRRCRKMKKERWFRFMRREHTAGAALCRSQLGGGETRKCQNLYDLSGDGLVFAPGIAGGFGDTGNP